MEGLVLGVADGLDETLGVGVAFTVALAVGLGVALTTGFFVVQPFGHFGDTEVTFLTAVPL